MCSWPLHRWHCKLFLPFAFALALGSLEGVDVVVVVALLALVTFQLALSFCPHHTQVFVWMFSYVDLPSLLIDVPSLDEVLEDLPCVHDHAPMDPLWSVQGQRFLECFCGGAVVTLALIWSQVPVMRPWDVEADENFDVLSFGHLIFSLI